MSWFKLMHHDLRCGLLRWRYLAAMLLCVFPCLTLCGVYPIFNTTGTWMDCMLYFFQGKESIVRLSPSDRIVLPIFWLVEIGGCLFMNLDYPLSDLTNFGQQVIIRGGTRRGWYLSKCLWNLCACVVYFLVLAFAALVFTLLTGGNLTLHNTEELSMFVFAGIMNPVSLSLQQCLLLAIVLPFLTIAALSMLQMTLCFFVKPVVSFFACMCILVIAIYWDNPFSLGNGAMTLRSSIIAADGNDPYLCALTALAVIVVCVIMGAVRFSKMDILGLEE